MTLDEVKQYIRIDFDDDDSLIQELINTAQIFIDSMVGAEYKKDEKLVRIANLLVKKLVNDMYENRYYTVSSNTKKDIIINSMLDRLALGIWSEEDGS